MLVFTHEWMTLLGGTVISIATHSIGENLNISHPQLNHDNFTQYWLNFGHFCPLTRSITVQLQIEELSRRLRSNDLGISPNPEDRLALLHQLPLTRWLLSQLGAAAPGSPSPASAPAHSSGRAKWADFRFYCQYLISVSFRFLPSPSFSHDNSVLPVLRQHLPLSLKFLWWLFG